MPFEPLTRYFAQDALAKEALAQRSTQRVLLETVRSVLPPELAKAVVVVATRAQALIILTHSHASATKLYQYRQSILAAFSSNDLTITDIRVSVQPATSNNTGQRARRQHEPITPRAFAALDKLINNSENEKLKTALRALQQHSKPPTTPL